MKLYINNPKKEGDLKRKWEYKNDLCNWDSFFLGSPDPLNTSWSSRG